MADRRSKSFVFLKSILEAGVDIFKIKPMPNQFFEDGTVIKPLANVQCERDKRKAHPEGTIFVCNYLHEMPTYYRASSEAVKSDMVMEAAALIQPDKTYKITEGFAASPAYKTFLDYCNNNGIQLSGVSTQVPEDEPAKIRRVNFFKKIEENYPTPKLEDCGMYIETEFWTDLVRNYKRRKNTLIVGPTGTGKTQTLRLVAQALGKNLISKKMNVMNDPQAALLGVHRMMMVDGHVQSVFDLAKFVEEIQDPNNIILLEEISRASPAANNILLSLLDDERLLPLDLADSRSSHVVKAHDEVVFFANANRGARYTGVQTLDPALVNRHIMLELGYMKKEHESLVLQKRCFITAKEADQIATFAEDIRRQEKEDAISETLSHRDTLEIGNYVSDGLSFKAAAEKIVFPIFGDEQRDLVVAALGRY